MYDHTQCPSTAHDRDPGTALDDGQPVDEHGQLLCRDCTMPLMYCTTFGDYDHVDPSTPPCFLVPHNNSPNTEASGDESNIQRMTPMSKRVADGAPRVIELDESARCDNHRYSYTRIVRIGGHRVRARIERDFCPFQSRAVADVLARDMTWTHLAADDPAHWIDTTTPPGHGPIHCATELGHLADTLINRAAAILLD